MDSAITRFYFSADDSHNRKAFSVWICECRVRRNVYAIYRKVRAAGKIDAIGLIHVWLYVIEVDTSHRWFDM